MTPVQIEAAVQAQRFLIDLAHAEASGKDYIDAVQPEALRALLTRSRKGKKGTKP